MVKIVTRYAFVYLCRSKCYRITNTRVAELIMLHSHSMDHQVRETTLVTATQIAFIAGGKRLVGTIVDFCVHKKLWFHLA